MYSQLAERKQLDSRENHHLSYMLCGTCVLCALGVPCVCCVFAVCVCCGVLYVGVCVGGKEKGRRRRWGLLSTQKYERFTDALVDPVDEDHSRHISMSAFTDGGGDDGGGGDGDDDGDGDGK